MITELKETCALNWLEEPLKIVTIRPHEECDLI
jgi:hypothetical protein